MMKKFSPLLLIPFSIMNPLQGQLTPPPPPKVASAEAPKERASSEEIVIFTPPATWMMADASALPGRVRTMVIGKSASSFPPSINLSTEPYKGTLRQYLKIVKNMNAAQGYEWKDLGTIQTQAGPGSLSQVDTKTQWGTVRLMHVILVKNGHVYILTASALKDDFPRNYKDFFTAMRSLRIAKDLYEMIPEAQMRSQLQTSVSNLESQWKTMLSQKKNENPQMKWDELQEKVFNSEQFQTTLWIPLKEMLKEKFSQQGEEWQSLFLQKLEDQLFSLKF